MKPVLIYSFMCDATYRAPVSRYIAGSQVITTTHATYVYSVLFAGTSSSQDDIIMTYGSTVPIFSSKKVRAILHRLGSARISVVWTQWIRWKISSLVLVLCPCKIAWGWGWYRVMCTCADGSNYTFLSCYMYAWGYRLAYTLTKTEYRL